MRNIDLFLGEELGGLKGDEGGHGGGVSGVGLGEGNGGGDVALQHEVRDLATGHLDQLSGATLRRRGCLAPGRGSCR